MKKALLCIVAVVGAAGCNHIWRTAYPQAYLTAMDAAKTVLARHFDITSVDWDKGVITASGDVGVNLSSQCRVRAEAHVYRLPHNAAPVYGTPMDGAPPRSPLRGVPYGVTYNEAYDIDVRVVNELEISEPTMLGGPRLQPGHDWRAYGFNHALEAQLMAEVQNQLGRPYRLRGIAGTGVFPLSPQQGAPATHSALFPPLMPAMGGVMPAPPLPAPNPLAPTPVPPVPEPPRPQSAAPERSAGTQLFDQYMALGDQYLRRREHDRALLEYQRATLAQPRNPVPYLSLAGIWTVLGRYNAGAEAIRQAADAAGSHPLAGTDLVRLRGLTEDANQRVLLLKGWCRQNPGDRDARLLLGYHCLLADRPDEARAALQEILQDDPKDSGASYLLRQADARRS